MLEGLWSVLFLLALGVPGWLVLDRLRVPAAPLVGSMISVAAVTALGSRVPTPPEMLRPALQVIIGLLVGARVTGGLGRTLRRLAVPALVVSVWWLAAGLMLGYVLFRLTHLDVVTAFLGSAAGGMAEMSLLAVSLDGDPAKVAVLQFFRVSITLMVVPVMGPLLLPRSAWARAAATTDPSGSSSLPSGCQRVADGEGAGSRSILRAVLGILPSRDHVRTVAAATVGGLALHHAGLPAGGIIGSMIAVGGVTLAGYGCPTFPEWARLGTRLGLGGLIGLSFTADTIRSLVQVAVPVAILTAVMLANGFVLALLLRKVTGWNMETCVLSTSAAGLSQMGMIAEDLGADPVVVTILHLVRLVSIIVIVPPLVAMMLL